MSISTQGFEVFAQSLNGSVLSELKKATEELCARFRLGEKDLLAHSVSIREVMEANPHKNPDVSVDSVENEPFIIGNLCQFDRRFIRGILQPKLWEIAALILQKPVQELVYHFANITRKPAGIGPAISPHRDFPNQFICPGQSNFVRLLIPLEPMCSGNGGTGIEVGSHMISDQDALNVAMPETGSLDLFYPELEPGDVLAIHPRVIHASPPNRSECDRCVFIVQFGTKGALMRHCDDEALSLLTVDEMLFNTSQDSLALRGSA